jgi:hypothetical protein
VLASTRLWRPVLAPFVSFLEHLGVEVFFYVHAEGVYDVARVVRRSAHSATTLPTDAGIRHVALRVSITSGASSTTWQ